jgi:hypothetical protein
VYNKPNIVNPPNQTETVLCAVASLSGLIVYYGRGVITGDWYINLPLEDDPELLKAGIDEALEEGERIVEHPYGPLMVRLDWLGSAKEHPQDRALIEELRQRLERMPPQAIQ